jgi:hypothetical protein
MDAGDALVQALRHAPSTVPTGAVVISSVETLGHHFQLTFALYRLSPLPPHHHDHQHAHRANYEEST